MNPGGEIAVTATVTPQAGTAEAFPEEVARQQTTAAHRIDTRAIDRHTHETQLRGPGGLAAADDPARIIKRVDRLRQYYAGSDAAGPITAALAESPLGAEPGDGRPAVIDEPATAVLLEKVINTADFLGVRYLEAGVEACRAIGRVLIRDETGIVQGYGTGFLVSPALLLTNHHVLPDSDVARTSAIEFNYQDGIDGLPLPSEVFGLAPETFFVADRELDFALVAVAAPPNILARFGFNRLTDAQGTVIIGEAVTIVQHPGGRPKQIVLRENRLVDIPELVVHYSADTEPGSSGSPVFNDQWEVAALHHASVRTPEHQPSYTYVNEGIRISRILRHLRSQLPELPSAWQELAGPLLGGAEGAGPARAAIPAPGTGSAPGVHLPVPDADTSGTPGREITVEVPLQITIQLGATTDGVVAKIGPATTAVAATEGISIDPDYTNRAGYDPCFLGRPLPLPGLSPELAAAASPELTYHHFSVVMHRPRRLALFTAVNIDGKQVQHPHRDNDRWILDPRLAASEQTGEDVYRHNPLDRGHLVRRLDPAWGPTAKAANDDTFHFTNCSPQHHGFNAGHSLWLGLEDYILHNSENSDLLVTVLTGPVLQPDDPPYRGVALPRQYWKVVSMVTTEGSLSTTAYLLSQAALLDEFVEEEFSFAAYGTFQVPVRRIADLTGLDLGAYITDDPLEHLEAAPLPREILRPEDLVLRSHTHA